MDFLPFGFDNALEEGTAESFVGLVIDVST